MVRREQELGISQRLKRVAVAATLVGLSAVLAAESASPAHADPPSLSDRVYELIDEIRWRYGLTSLQRSESLDRIAVHRAGQISTKFSHDTSALSSLFQLYEESTYSTRAEVLGWISQGGTQAPEAIVKMLERSCDPRNNHRNVILWPEAERVGIGAIDDNGTVFVAGVLTGNGRPSKDCP